MGLDELFIQIGGQKEIYFFFIRKYLLNHHGSRIPRWSLTTPGP